MNILECSTYLRDVTNVPMVIKHPFSGTTQQAKIWTDLKNKEGNVHWIWLLESDVESSRLNLAIIDIGMPRDFHSYL